jgi:beta-lactamase class A
VIRLQVIFVLLCSLLATTLAAAEPVKQRQLRAKLEQTIAKLDREFDGVAGVGILDLSTGELILHNGDEVFPVASTIKIAVLAELFRQVEAGSIQLEEPYQLKASDLVGGTGVLIHLTAARLTIRDLATLMIVLSDNSAANVLIDRLGIENINALLDRLGLKETRLRRKMMDEKAASEGRENTSTPRELLRLLEAIYRQRVVAADRTAELLDLLSLPKKSEIARDLLPQTRVAGKPGDLSGVQADAAIVFVKDRPFAIAVLTSYAGDSEAAEELISRVAAAAFGYFDRLARSSPLGRRY